MEINLIRNSNKIDFHFKILNLLQTQCFINLQFVIYNS